MHQYTNVKDNNHFDITFCSALMYQWRKIKCRVTLSVKWSSDRRTTMNLYVYNCMFLPFLLCVSALKRGLWYMTHNFVFFLTYSHVLKQIILMGIIINLLYMFLKVTHQKHVFKSFKNRKKHVLRECYPTKEGISDWWTKKHSAPSGRGVPC